MKRALIFIFALIIIGNSTALAQNRPIIEPDQTMHIDIIVDKGATNGFKVGAIVGVAGGFIAGFIWGYNEFGGNSQSSTTRSVAGLLAFLTGLGGAGLGFAVLPPIFVPFSVSLHAAPRGGKGSFLAAFGGTIIAAGLGAGGVALTYNYAKSDTANFIGYGSSILVYFIMGLYLPAKFYKLTHRSAVNKMSMRPIVRPRNLSSYAYAKPKNFQRFEMYYGLGFETTI